MEKSTNSNINKGFLSWVERIGNKIPHAGILFVGLIILIAIISFILNLAGVSATNPTTNEVVKVNNLLSAEGLNFALQGAVDNFTSFAPLGLVLTMTLGIGLAEKVGFMSAFLRRTISGAPARLVTFIIALVGICGNIASDAAQVIIPIIASMIFLSLGRHPVAGIALGYAAASAGFSANLLIAGTDALLSGITNEAVGIVNAPKIPVTANWYFMIVSTFVLSITVSIVSEKIIEPRLEQYKGTNEIVKDHVTPKENKALKKSLIAFIIFLAVLIALAAPETSFLRNPETGSLIESSPLMAAIIPLMLILFLAVSIPYGISIGKIKKSADVMKYMTESISEMASFIVLAFIMGQFIAYFNWTNIGLILAIGGANLLESSGFTSIPLFVSFIIICAFIDLFIGSGSAKWAILAPTFVPMFYLLGYHPAFTQLLYRIGDSTTNIVSPLNAYLPIVLGYVQEYDKDAGIGTLLSLTVPYTLVMLAVWIVLMIVWYFLGLPLGPGGFIGL